jgi:hypothetical protein
LAIDAQYVHHSDIFNGARPTRLICYQTAQDRYNGGHELNTNRLIFPNINYFQVKINEANIPPLITNAAEAYTNLVVFWIIDTVKCHFHTSIMQPIMVYWQLI